MHGRFISLARTTSSITAEPHSSVASVASIAPLQPVRHSLVFFFLTLRAAAPSDAPLLLFCTVTETRSSAQLPRPCLESALCASPTPKPCEPRLQGATLSPTPVPNTATPLPLPPLLPPPLVAGSTYFACSLITPFSQPHRFSTTI